VNGFKLDPTRGNRRCSECKTNSNALVVPAGEILYLPPCVRLGSLFILAWTREHVALQSDGCGPEPRPRSSSSIRNQYIFWSDSKRLYSFRRASFDCGFSATGGGSLPIAGALLGDCRNGAKSTTLVGGKLSRTRSAKEIRENCDSAGEGMASRMPRARVTRSNGNA
jgi:hypothetical protein